MTREEAIRCLSVHSSTNGSGLCTNKQHYEAKQMAIKALEQEPCEDAISRQAAIKAIYDNKDRLKIAQAIRELPSVISCEYKILPKEHGRKFEKIVVEYPPKDLCAYPECRGKPYFSIKYEENGEHFIGFGTYKTEVLSNYLQEYFIAPTIIEADTESEDEE